MGCSNSNQVVKVVKPFEKQNALPIIVHSQRMIPAGSHETFDAGYLAAQQYLFENVSGTKAVFYARDEENPNLLHDVQWFSSLDQFYAHADMTNEATKNAIMGWTKNYDMSVPMQGDVFGNFDQTVI